MSKPEINYDWPENTDEQEKIIRRNEMLMQKLANELRDIRSSSAAEDDDEKSKSPLTFKVKVDTEDGEGMRESRQQSAKMHRASSALLDVYDEHGAAALVQTIVALKEFQDTGKFDVPQYVRDTLAGHYSLRGSANEPKLDRRTVVFGAGLLVALGAGGSRWYINREKDRLQAERREKMEQAIDLESEEKPSKEQKKAMLTLQRIDLPELDGKISSLSEQDNDLRYVLYPAIIVALVGLGMSARSTPEGAKESPLAESLLQLDDTLSQACDNIRPRIDEISSAGRRRA